MDDTRRSFLKNLAASCAAAVAAPGLLACGSHRSARADSSDPLAGDDAITWGKAPCRFCGTGCGVMVGVKDGRVVAVAGDKEAHVNKGLLCVKGYHLPGILYGADRLTRPLLRQNGKLVEISMEQAIDTIATRFRDTIDQHGKDSVCLYASGQSTVQDGYAAVKFMKGGLGTNNLEANARLCMASAVVGFLTTFGKDEPMGCYDDFENGDVFVFWGNNMAEMHPVLFSRILERKRTSPWVKLVDIATRRTRTTEASDLFLEFRPQADLAIANAICHEIVAGGQVAKTFVERHVAFKKGTTDIGWGIEGQPIPAISAELSSFDEYRAFLEPYTPEYAEQISGVPAATIRELAGWYADPHKRVVSLWCMGMNQHTRGTWINNLVYNIHLLTGKISQPGSGPFSLTGQPSACGTVREVGVLTHALPGGRNVENPEHRAFAEKLWGVPAGTIPDKPSNHTIAMFRGLEEGRIKAMWIQTTNPMVTLPDRDKFLRGIEKHKPFIVVSDIYPTPTTAIADLIMPSSCWVEREGVFGNSERRSQQWNQLVEPPGECRPDSWQTIAVARKMGFEKLFPWQDEPEQARGLFEEYREFTLGVGKDLASYDQLKQARGLRWPVIDGRETRWRYREGSDPYVEAGAGYSFYGNKTLDHRAVIWQRPYQPPPEEPDDDYPFWLCTGRVLEHWHTGSMTRRVKQLHQAVPHAYVELNREDARLLGVSTGSKIKLTSRRGSLVIPASVGGRGEPAQGSVFVPFFDESLLVNVLTLDAHCPMSKQPDYKKCAVRVERA